MNTAPHGVIRRLSGHARQLPWLRRLYLQIPGTTLHPTAPDLLNAFAKVHPDASFVQIGSNDGVHLDPLHAKLPTTRWHGVMVEPVPHIFRKLVENCRHFGDRLAFENAAIAGTDGALPFYYLRPAAPEERESLPHFYNLLGSFRRDVLLSHAAYIPDIEERLVTADVPCLSFESLCRKHGLERVDLLHLDVEGYDFELLRSIDFSRFRPRLLIYEHHHLGDRDRADCEAYLHDFGYVLLKIGMDSWCLNVQGLTNREQRLARLWRRFNLRP